jgi:hypothetical protein
MTEAAENPEWSRVFAHSGSELKLKVTPAPNS